MVESKNEFLGTALMSGKKVNFGTINVNGRVALKNCSALQIPENQIDSIFKYAQDAGTSTELKLKFLEIYLLCDQGKQLDLLQTHDCHTQLLQPFTQKQLTKIGNLMRLHQMDVKIFLNN